MIVMFFSYNFLDILFIVWYCLLEVKVNNIAIKLEKIHFDEDTIGELNKFAKIYKMEVTTIMIIL